MKYTYTITDTVTNKLIYRNLTGLQAAEILGIEQKLISQELTKANPRNGMRLKAVCIPGEQKYEPNETRYIYINDGRRIMLPLDLEMRWNETMKYAGELAQRKRERQAGS